MQNIYATELNNDKMDILREAELLSLALFGLGTLAKRCNMQCDCNRSYFKPLVTVYVRFSRSTKTTNQHSID